MITFTHAKVADYMTLTIPSYIDVVSSPERKGKSMFSSILSYAHYSIWSTSMIRFTAYNLFSSLMSNLYLALNLAIIKRIQRGEG